MATKVPTKSKATTTPAAKRAAKPVDPKKLAKLMPKLTARRSAHAPVGGVTIAPGPGREDAINNEARRGLTSPAPKANGNGAVIAASTVKPTVIPPGKKAAKKGAPVVVVATASNGVSIAATSLTAAEAMLADGAPPVIVRSLETPAQKAAREQAAARHATKVASAATQETTDMPTKTMLAALKATVGHMPTTTAKARKSVAPKVEPAPAIGKTMPRKDSGRYDWAAAEQAAHKGKMPLPPDFSANTHKYKRPLLAEAVKAAKARDVDALKKIKCGTSTSPRAVDRYRNLCLIAIKASA